MVKSVSEECYENQNLWTGDVVFCLVIYDLEQWYWYCSYKEFIIVAGPFL
jgi:hypothetical protein